MSLGLSLLLVAIGLGLLTGGGEALVRGAVAIARQAGLTPAVIGLTIVAMGTSLPELVVSVLASLSGQPDIAVGNVVGSNIFNIAGVLGVSALLIPLPILGNVVRLRDLRGAAPLVRPGSGLFFRLSFSPEPVMSNEPEYIRRLREAQAARQGKKAAPAAPAAQGTLTPQEQEALRWAKEVAEGEELRTVRNLAGARFAVLVRIQGATGQKLLSLEGIADRDILRERVKPGATVGEEVLGAYEVRGGRPVTVATEEGQIVLKMGAPRPGAQPVDPQKMLRMAAREAEKREKERPKERPGGRR